MPSTKNVKKIYWVVIFMKRSFSTVRHALNGWKVVGGEKMAWNHFLSNSHPDIIAAKCVAFVLIMNRTTAYPSWTNKIKCTRERELAIHIEVAFKLTASQDFALVIWIFFACVVICKRRKLLPGKKNALSYFHIFVFVHIAFYFSFINFFLLHCLSIQFKLQQTRSFGFFEFTFRVQRR